jgi:hypothetical protein
MLIFYIKNYLQIQILIIHKLYFKTIVRQLNEIADNFEFNGKLNCDQLYVARSFLENLPAHKIL